MSLFRSCNSTFSFHFFCLSALHFFFKFCTFDNSSHADKDSTTLAKKKNHHRDSRREERCSTCDIMLDQARSAQGKSDPRLSATFALRWSRLIEHDITRGTAFFSPRISRMVLFFLARVVQQSAHLSDSTEYLQPCPALMSFFQRCKRTSTFLFIFFFSSLRWRIFKFFMINLQCWWIKNLHRTTLLLETHRLTFHSASLLSTTFFLCDKQL